MLMQNLPMLISDVFVCDYMQYRISYRVPAL